MIADDYVAEGRAVLRATCYKSHWNTDLYLGAKCLRHGDGNGFSGGTANGGVDTSADQAFDIVITPVNDAPVAVDNSYSGNEDTQQTGHVIDDDTGEGADFDVDGDGMTISSNTNVVHGRCKLRRSRQVPGQEQQARWSVHRQWYGY